MDRRPLLTFYGDDFTGSTDSTEVLALAGIRTLLFLDPPDPDVLENLEGVEAVGVAGSSRTMSPEEMAHDLLPIFTRMKALNGRLFHYKLCSTFDSSPRLGSVGQAIDVGQRVFASSFVPLLVAAPPLSRYSAFGNLFARSGLDCPVFRLDRHPTMAVHPVTPMRESDLRVHLAEQTTKHVALFDVLQMDAPAPIMDRQFDALLTTQPDIVLFDALYDAHLEAIGRLIWERARQDNSIFVAGSSGVEYALVAHWSHIGTTSASVQHADPGSVERTIVVSGSCSPVTDRQIECALEDGFIEIALRPDRLVQPEFADAEIDDAVLHALPILASGRSIIIHTCRGPSDPRLVSSTEVSEGCRADRAIPRRQLGVALGQILRSILAQTRIRRACVVGGDTSGWVARELGIESLEVIAPIAPGSPLCQANAPGTSIDGLEIVFKGGQVGKSTYFGQVLAGKSSKETGAES